MEEWKDVEGYEGLYQVSNEGRVKSLEKRVPGKCGCSQVKRERILKVTVNSGGYPHCDVYKNGKHETVSVHRLVADAFISNPDNLPCVNHKDGDKTNNNVSNLEWVTYKENTAHAVSTGLLPMTDKHREAARQVGIRNGKKILCSNGIEYPSIAEAARSLDLSQGNVWQVVNNKRKHTKGYSFQYVRGVE